MTTTKRLGRPPKKPEDLRTGAILALAKHARRRTGEIMRTSALDKAKRLGIHINAHN